MNQITLIGRVGQAPVAKSFDDTGNKVVKFSIAVKEVSSNSEEKKTLWLDVDAWNGLGDRVLKLVTKGREVGIIGRIAVSKYTKEVNGEKVEMVKPVVKLTNFHLCGAKPAEEGEEEPVEKPKATRKMKVAS